MKILKFYTWEYYRPHGSVQLKEANSQYLPVHKFEGVRQQNGHQTNFRSNVTTTDFVYAADSNVNTLLGYKQT